MTAVLVEKLQTEYDALRGEFQVCRRKLDSKCEALSILSKELDQCRSERDQFKLMAEQLGERYQGLKRQLAGLSPRSSTSSAREFPELPGQNLGILLCEMRDSNKSLRFEADDLKQKLADARGDIKLLREQIARQRVGTTDEGLTTRHFPAHEREELVKQLEAAQEQYVQLQRDLQQCLDEKEELVTERDVYKNKYERLNQELNYILKGDEKRIIDIDAISMENKYLQERLKQMEEEKSMAMATVSKYKTLLERKKTKGIMKIGQTGSGGLVITPRQVKDMLDFSSRKSASPQALDDLQSVARALLESLNDKNLALSHQRKTNKILGCRVAELEKKLKTLEVSGLWNIPGRSPSESLEKLKMEFEDMKTLLPLGIIHDATHKDVLDDMDSPELSPESTPLHLMAGMRKSLPLEEDLDLLPTKEGLPPQSDIGSVSSPPNEMTKLQNHSICHHGDGDSQPSLPEHSVVIVTSLKTAVSMETNHTEQSEERREGSEDGVDEEESSVDEQTSLLHRDAVDTDLSSDENTRLYTDRRDDHTDGHYESDTVSAYYDDMNSTKDLTDNRSVEEVHSYDIESKGQGDSCDIEAVDVCQPIEEENSDNICSQLNHLMDDAALKVMCGEMVTNSPDSPQSPAADTSPLLGNH